MCCHCRAGHQQAKRYLSRSSGRRRSPGGCIDRTARPFQGITQVGTVSILFVGVGTARYLSSVAKPVVTASDFFFRRNDREIHSKTEPAITAGDNMAEYAILSIATLCQRNPRIDMPGTLPKLGSRLTVNMGLPVSAPGLLVAIAVIHSIIVVIAWYYSRCVVIKDDSSFSTARLLRPLVNHLGASGTLLDGRGIDEAIRGTAGGVVYGPRESSKVGEYSLDIAEDIQCLKQWPLGRHPEGTYV